MSYYNSARYSRGHGRGWNRGRQPPTPVVARLPTPDTAQKCFKVIPIPVVQDVKNSESLRIRNVQYVASYNWTDKSVNSILVPGQPPKWLPPVNAQQLNEDNDETHGPYYRDQNSARYPSFPIEPAVRAIYKLNDEFDAASIDIFGCGNTFGSILSFVRNEDRTFRFGIERIGKTIFLVRKTNTPKELIKDVRGYGHSFPEAYTMWESSVGGSASHQRIICYDLGGLQCMVRSECDGYLPNKQPAVAPTSGRQGDDQALSKSGVSLEDAFSALAQTRLSGDPSAKLNIEVAGQEVTQKAIFDLKTRSIRRKDDVDLSEFLPRLWVNQTPNFVLAFHSSGTFNDIDIKDVRQDIIQWELSNSTLIAKFRAILTTLISLSQTHSSFEVRRTGRGSLEFWNEVTGWSALPSELKKRWSGIGID